MTDTKCLGDPGQRHNGRVALSPFDPTDILLAQFGAFGNLLLGQLRGGAQSREVPADQLAHVHALTNRPKPALSLSTKVCKCGCIFGPKHVTRCHPDGDTNQGRG
jgi:hypothetical protein